MSAFDEFYLQALRERIEEFGMLRPIVLATFWNAALDALLEELPSGSRALVAEKVERVRVKPYNVMVKP